jgi:hypothetical protein
MKPTRFVDQHAAAAQAFPAAADRGTGQRLVAY